MNIAGYLGEPVLRSQGTKMVLGGHVVERPGAHNPGMYPDGEWNTSGS